MKKTASAVTITIRLPQEPRILPRPTAKSWPSVPPEVVRPPRLRRRAQRGDSVESVRKPRTTQAVKNVTRL